MVSSCTLCVPPVPVLPNAWPSTWNSMLPTAMLSVAAALSVIVPVSPAAAAAGAVSVVTGAAVSLPGVVPASSPPPPHEASASSAAAASVVIERLSLFMMSFPAFEPRRILEDRPFPHCEEL